MTDVEHWGVVERWNMGEDGYGDCEDYALLKRHMLMQAGWPREALLMYYRAADYTVLYSGYEGLSHVLLESLRIRTPVIASDRGGNPEVVEDGVNGLLVPYIDVDALAGAFRTAFEGDTRRRLAKNTSINLERFGWGVLVKQTIEILERVKNS